MRRRASPPQPSRLRRYRFPAGTYLAWCPNVGFSFSLFFISFARLRAISKSSIGVFWVCLINPCTTPIRPPPTKNTRRAIRRLGRVERTSHKPPPRDRQIGIPIGQPNCTVARSIPIARLSQVEVLEASSKPALLRQPLDRKTLEFWEFSPTSYFLDQITYHIRYLLASSPIRHCPQNTDINLCHPPRGYLQILIRPRVRIHCAKVSPRSAGDLFPAPPTTPSP